MSDRESDGTGPGPVSVLVWQLPAARVPLAVTRMATDPVRLRRDPGLAFVKLLGTGDATTFSPRAATLRRWMLVAEEARPGAVLESPVVAAWDRLATERWRADLQPLSARGAWSGGKPFRGREGRTWDGPVAALTRARIAPAKLATFWRAVPPVARDLHDRTGLLYALGMGEAPIGVQGTFSLWRSAADLTTFAYRGAAHREAVRRTGTERWYAEELFARFGVRSATGTLDGRDPIAGGPADA